MITIVNTMNGINIKLVLFQDEEPETSWMLIQENDLVALFSQFPFDAIFKHILKMDPNIPSKLEKVILKFWTVKYIANFYFKFYVIFLYNISFG